MGKFSFRNVNVSLKYWQKTAGGYFLAHPVDFVQHVVTLDDLDLDPKIIGWQICLWNISFTNFKNCSDVETSHPGVHMVAGPRIKGGGAKSPPKREICASRPPYLSHNDQKLPEQVVLYSTAYEHKMPLNSGHFRPMGPKPPRKGEMCASQPQFLTHSDKHLPENVVP